MITDPTQINCALVQLLEAVMLGMENPDCLVVRIRIAINRWCLDNQSSENVTEVGKYHANGAPSRVNVEQSDRILVEAPTL